MKLVPAKADCFQLLRRSGNAQGNSGSTRQEIVGLLTDVVLTLFS